MLAKTRIELYRPATRTVTQGQRANIEPEPAWSGTAHLQQLTAAQSTRALGLHADGMWTCHVRLPHSVTPSPDWTAKALGKTFAVRNAALTLFWTLDLQEA